MRLVVININFYCIDCVNGKHNYQIRYTYKHTWIWFLYFFLFDRLFSLNFFFISFEFFIHFIFRFDIYGVIPFDNFLHFSFVALYFKSVSQHRDSMPQKKKILLLMIVFHINFLFIAFIYLKLTNDHEQNRKCNEFCMWRCHWPLLMLNELCVESGKNEKTKRYTVIMCESKLRIEL